MPKQQTLNTFAATFAALTSLAVDSKRDADNVSLSLLRTFAEWADADSRGRKSAPDGTPMAESDAWKQWKDALDSWAKDRAQDVDAIIRSEYSDAVVAQYDNMTADAIREVVDDDDESPLATLASRLAIRQSRWSESKTVYIALALGSMVAAKVLDGSQPYGKGVALVRKDVTDAGLGGKGGRPAKSDDPMAKYLHLLATAEAYADKHGISPKDRATIRATVAGNLAKAAK